jgi:uncharacterized protein (UPF0262 family)|tara:strand:- start:897 stop:1133 length:237 start_codon:yes stop_codon:yes gene_type:complete
MYNYWYGITEKEIIEAKDTIDFLEERKQKIYDLVKENLTDDVKQKEKEKLNRINLSLNAIKYYYSINSKINEDKDIVF